MLNIDVYNIIEEGQLARYYDTSSKADNMVFEDFLQPMRGRVTGGSSSSEPGRHSIVPHKPSAVDLSGDEGDHNDVPQLAAHRSETRAPEDESVPDRSQDVHTNAFGHGSSPTYGGSNNPPEHRFARRKRGREDIRADGQALPKSREIQQLEEELRISELRLAIMEKKRKLEAARYGSTSECGPGWNPRELDYAGSQSLRRANAFVGGLQTDDPEFLDQPDHFPLGEGKTLFRTPGTEQVNPSGTRFCPPLLMYGRSSEDPTSADVGASQGSQEGADLTEIKGTPPRSAVQVDEPPGGAVEVPCRSQDRSTGEDSVDALSLPLDNGQLLTQGRSDDVLGVETDAGARGDLAIDNGAGDNDGKSEEPPGCGKGTDVEHRVGGSPPLDKGGGHNDGKGAESLDPYSIDFGKEHGGRKGTPSSLPRESPPNTAIRAAPEVPAVLKREVRSSGGRKNILQKRKVVSDSDETESDGDRGGGDGATGCPPSDVREVTPRPARKSSVSRPAEKGTSGGGAGRKEHHPGKGGHRPGGTSSDVEEKTSGPADDSVRNAPLRTTAGTAGRSSRAAEGRKPPTNQQVRPWERSAS